MHWRTFSRHLNFATISSQQSTIVFYHHYQRHTRYSLTIYKLSLYTEMVRSDKRQQFHQTGSNSKCTKFHSDHYNCYPEHLALSYTSISLPHLHSPLHERRPPLVVPCTDIHSNVCDDAQTTKGGVVTPQNRKSLPSNRILLVQSV